MAKFVKGQIANPLGAGAHNRRLKTARRLTKEELAEVMTLLVSGDCKTLEDIVEHRNDPDVRKRPSVLRVWIAMSALKAIQKGDINSLNALMDRVVGKVKDEIELSGKVDSTVTTINRDEFKALKAQFDSEY